MAREERSAGFIAFCVASNRAATSIDATPRFTEYLLLDHGRHWSFPKGHVEPGEDDLAAAIRELCEETGISRPNVISDFRHEIQYFFRHRSHGLTRKAVTYFLARVPNQPLALSDEHVAGEFLPFERAVRRVTFASDREVLRQAHAHLLNLFPNPKRTAT